MKLKDHPHIKDIIEIEITLHTYQTIIKLLQSESIETPLFIFDTLADEYVKEKIKEGEYIRLSDIPTKHGHKVTKNQSGMHTIISLLKSNNYIPTRKRIKGKLIRVWSQSKMI